MVEAEGEARGTLKRLESVQLNTEKELKSAKREREKVREQCPSLHAFMYLRRF